MSDIYICSNPTCGEKMSGNTKYCKFCRTAEQRKAQDEENKKIKEERLNK